MLVVEAADTPLEQLAQLYAPAASAVMAEGKDVWLWVTQEQSKEHSLTEYWRLAADLGTQHLVIPDYVASRDWLATG